MTSEERALKTHTDEWHYFNLGSATDCMLEGNMSSREKTADISWHHEMTSEEKASKSQILYWWRPTTFNLDRAIINQSEALPRSG